MLILKIKKIFYTGNNIKNKLPHSYTKQKSVAKKYRKPLPSIFSFCSSTFHRDYPIHTLIIHTVSVNRNLVYYYRKLQLLIIHTQHLFLRWFSSQTTQTLVSLPLPLSLTSPNITIKTKKNSPSPILFCGHQSLHREKKT